MYSFTDDNPATSFFSIQPDRADTSNHFYPKPNVVDFGYYGSIGSFVSYVNQKVGQLTSSNTPATYNNVATSISTDSGTGVQWNKKRLEPNQSISYIIFIGRGTSAVTAIGSLNYELSASSQQITDTNAPTTITMNMRNTNFTRTISDVQVKFYYDPQYIQPVDNNGALLPPSGSEEATIHGTQNIFPYIPIY